MFPSSKAFGGRSTWRQRRYSFLLFVLCCWAGQLWVVQAWAGGPRYVTGPPFFTGPAGVAIGWKQQTLLYSTDPGDLSSSVSHAAADALVAAAAGVWNVPYSSITVAQGTGLAEHVSSANVYLDAAGLHWPADVAALPLSILYDSDGSVTDTLLGSGASLPSGCRQNGVTESVDGFDPAGYITHAIVIVNGRCTGIEAAAQLQLQYQLMRVFGRVLGLAWSQTNDNVFTGSPQPTSVQAQNWPIMHPLDIICGLYTYQCLPSPFTLRPDDISALVSVYPIDGSKPVPSGKQLSYAQAQGLAGSLTFPTGEGMAGVNVLVRRIAPNTTLQDAFVVASAVTGTYFRRSGVSPFVTPDTGSAGSQGSLSPNSSGYYSVGWIPLLGSTGLNFDSLVVTSEPLNPLYTGEYSVGPYSAGIVTAPASVASTTLTGVTPGWSYLNQTLTDAPATCGTNADGTATAPLQVPQSGWWNGLLCAYGHVSYLQANVKPSRTFTVEVTALDGAGLASANEVMPVIGLYGPQDTPGVSLPSLGAAVSGLNGRTIGSTTFHASTGQASSILFAIADQRGDGRPDFNYRARLFYADSITPARVPATGGTITITGTGFRAGNTVAIFGASATGDTSVNATVTSWTATSLTAIVPSNMIAGTPFDVTVSDLTTGATSTLLGALVFDSSSTLPNAMRLVSAPAGSVYVSDVAVPAFAVQLITADGVTPVANTAVTFTATGSAAGQAVSFGGCPNPCTLLTDAMGMASVNVTPLVPGTIDLLAATAQQPGATAASLTQSASFTAIAQAGKMLITSTPESQVTTGQYAPTPFGVKLLAADSVTGLSGRAVTFSVTTGAATFYACQTAPCVAVTDQYGDARAYVTPTAPGPITLQARDGDLTQSVSLTGLSNTDVMTIDAALPAQIYIDNTDHLYWRILLNHSDGSPDGGEPVVFTISNGGGIYGCGGAPCIVTSTFSGQAQVAFSFPATGTYTVSASFGGVSQSQTVTIIAHQVLLKVISVPANGSPTGLLAPSAFTVQMIRDDGTPAANGNSVVMGGPSSAVLIPGCNAGLCEVQMNSSGIATVSLIPLIPGPITLTATSAPYQATATFTAVGIGKVMQIVQQPGPGGAPLLAQVGLGVVITDGGVPVAPEPVLCTVLSGPFVLDGFLTSYRAVTDANGAFHASGWATGFGPVVVQVTDGDVTQLIQFVVGSPPDVLRLVAAPASPTTVGSSALFTVQAFLPDGITLAPGKAIQFNFTAGSASFGGCTLATCTVTTDANGRASIAITPLAPGTIGLLASDGLATLAQSFVAVPAPDILQLISAPVSGGFAGSPAAGAFTVRVLLADGVTPIAGKSVAVAVTTGSATLAACAGAAACNLVTDAGGLVATGVTPAAAGSVTITLIDGSASISTSFLAVARPDTLRLVTAPTGTVPAGTPAGAFTVLLLEGDGVTPDAGRPILFTSSNANLLPCGLPACTLSTGADGTVSVSVTATMAGPVTLQAQAGTLSVEAGFNAIENTWSIVLVTPIAPSMPSDASAYIAEGASLQLPVVVAVKENGTPAPGQGITWTGTPVFLPELSTSLTGVDGQASTIATLGSLTAGQQAALQACDAAIAALCTTITAQGVSLAELQPTFLSGASQNITGGAPLGNVLLQIVDLAGHPVGGSPITVYQTVTALAQPCPDRGRCPSAPVLASLVTVVNADAGGQFTLQPITVEGLATQTEIAVSSGTEGFASTVLTRQP